MQETHVRTFIELVELDRRIADLSRELHHNAEKEIQLKERIERLDRDVDRADLDVKNLQKKIDDLDLELKVLEGKQERTREKQMAAKSEKEVSSLEHEMADLVKKRTVVDEQGLVILLDHEKAQKHAALLRADRPNKEAVLNKELEQLQARCDHVRKLHDAYLNDRTALEKQVPEDLMQRYVAMKKQISNPVVPVIKDGCSGCFYGLNKQELIKVEKGELVSCQGCYRLLYITKVETDEESDV